MFLAKKYLQAKFFSNFEHCKKELVPSGIEPEDGPTVIETKAAGVTVKIVDPAIVPTEAATVTVPVLML